MHTLVSTLALFILLFVDAFATVLPASPNDQTTISNCSGNVPPSNGYLSYFPTFSPQITGIEGWETWTITLPSTFNNSMAVFTWTRGDPASRSSNPNGPATFSAFTTHDNFSASITDTFLYEKVGDIGWQMSIGNNYLVFDGTEGFGFWNISVNIAGLIAEAFNELVPPGTPFQPSYNDVPNQVVPGYFANIPVPRAHFNGLITYPSGEVWELVEVSTVKHAYATQPIQNLVSSYSRGSAFIVGNTLNFIRAQCALLHEVDAAQLVISPETTSFSDVNVRYQATNDLTLLNMSSSGLSTTVAFPGCSATENYPFEFTSFPIAYRGAFVDSAGGKTEYYSMNTSSSMWLTGPYVENGADSIGVLEVYTRHS